MFIYYVYDIGIKETLGFRIFIEVITFYIMYVLCIWKRKKAQESTKIIVSKFRNEL